MFMHSPEPQILRSGSPSHPLYGQDLRTFSDDRLADAAARALLPGFSRLTLNFDYSIEAHQEFVELAGSVLRRVTRMIIQRTRIIRLTDAGDLNLEAQDDLLEAVTLAFVHMAGALDALAIINGLLAGEKHYSLMGWQKPRFRDAIREHSGAAVEIFDPGTAGAKYLHAVLNFRNTIHRLMPNTGTSGPANGDPAHRRAVLTLGWQGHREIFTSFEAVGWTHDVGIERIGHDFLMLRPATLISKLLNDGIPILNAVMEATPGQRLGPRVNATDPDLGLYPHQLRDYAVHYLHLTHLRPEHA